MMGSGQRWGIGSAGFCEMTLLSQGLSPVAFAGIARKVSPALTTPHIYQYGTLIPVQHALRFSGWMVIPTR